MSVITVTERLEDILDTLISAEEGKTYVGRPRGVAPGNLPAFVIMTGEASYDYEGSDLLLETRTYRLALLVQQWAAGAELETEQKCRPYFGTMISTFAGRPGLEHPLGENPLSGVQVAALTRDSGVVNIILAGKAYAGVEWQLQVTEYREVTYT